MENTQTVKDSLSTQTKASRNPAHQVYNVIELMRSVVQSCSWSTLMALSNANRSLRAQVFETVHQRVSLFVGLFVPEAHKSDFFTRLKDHDAVMVGGLVRCIMSADSPVYNRVNPEQMELIVRDIGHMVLWEWFFKDLGYHAMDSIAENRTTPYLGGARLFKFLMSADGSRTICLIKPRTTSIMPALLMGGTSAHLFVLSHSRFYCLYPELFARKEYVELRQDLSYIGRLPLKPFHFGLAGTRYFCDHPCGEACPTIWRTPTWDGGEGIAVMRWGGWEGQWDRGDMVSSEDTLSEEDEVEVLMWRAHARFGSCTNKLCEHYGRPVSLHQWQWPLSLGLE